MEGQPTSDLSTPVATINDTVITVGELQSQLNKQAAYIRPRYTSAAKQREFLDGMIKIELLADEAARLGYDKHPDAIRAMKQVMIQKLMKERFERRINPEDITDAELRAYYDKNSNEFFRAAEARVAAIVLNDKATADKVAKLAHSDQGKTLKGFRRLVADYSTDEDTKKRSGSLGHFTKDTTEDIPKPVIDAAFALDQTGKVAGPIDGGNALFYIIKKTGQRKEISQSFDAAKAQIRNRVNRENNINARKEFVRGLRDKATIKILDANLSKIRIDTSKPAAGHGSHGGHSH